MAFWDQPGKSMFSTLNENHKEKLYFTVLFSEYPIESNSMYSSIDVTLYFHFGLR